MENPPYALKRLDPILHFEEVIPSRPSQFQVIPWLVFVRLSCTVALSRRYDLEISTVNT